MMKRNGRRFSIERLEERTLFAGVTDETESTNIETDYEVGFDAVGIETTDDQSQSMTEAAYSQGVVSSPSIHDGVPEQQTEETSTETTPMPTNSTETEVTLDDGSTETVTTSSTVPLSEETAT